MMFAAKLLSDSANNLCIIHARFDHTKDKILAALGPTKVDYNLLSAPVRVIRASMANF